ncbi:unnamed protein product, partial [Urochloa humidicola]
RPPNSHHTDPTCRSTRFLPPPPPAKSARGHGHGHGGARHRLPVPSSSYRLRGSRSPQHRRRRRRRRPGHFGRPRRRQPRPRPRHLRLRDRSAVGTVLGAITGGLLGLATETGVVRGTGIGGITGALVSMEVVDSYLAMWRSDEPAIWSVVYVLDVIWSLLTGRLVREKVDPAVLSAVESQMSAVAAPVTHGDGVDIFETGGDSEGMARAAIDALPVVRFAQRGGDLVACSVCLQEFEAGESARSLPVCRHTFHLPCIDGWLLRHASCPLCRRVV